MSREFVKAVAVIALVAGGIYAYKRWQTPVPPPPAEVKRVPPTIGPAPTVTVQEQFLEQEEDLIARPVIATVYECAGPEGRVLSDKPCANDARTLQVRAPNGMDPAKVETPEKPQEGGGSSLSLNVLIPPLKTCAQLDKNEALLNKRLREDYSEEHKERFRQILRGYAVTRKEWKCGRAR
jgi:hypothetical protein